MTWTILLAILSNFDNKCRFKEFPPLLFFVPDQAVAPLALPEMKTCDQHEPWCSSCNNKKGCLHLTAESGFQMFKSLSEKMVCVLWSLFFDTLGQKISLLRSFLIFVFVFIAVDVFRSFTSLETDGCKFGLFCWKWLWFSLHYLGHTGEVLVIEEDFSRTRGS